MLRGKFVPKLDFFDTAGPVLTALVCLLFRAARNLLLLAPLLPIRGRDVYKECKKSPVTTRR